MLVQTEVDFDVDLDRDGLTVEFGGLELPLTDGFDSFFVESHAERALDANLLRTPVGAYNHP